MVLVTFSKPGHTNVIAADYLRRIKVKTIPLTVTLAPGCWAGSNRLAIRVEGKGISTQLFESTRSFKKATLKDIDHLIKQIKPARCSSSNCKGLYLTGGKLKINPDHLCSNHLTKSNPDAIVNTSAARTKKSSTLEKKIGKKSVFKVGDWVNAYRAGIFRIEKILPVFYEKQPDDQLSPGDRIYRSGELTDRRIILKQFLNAKFKTSISPYSCSERFVSFLNSRQHIKLKAIIKKNPEWLRRLDEYKLPSSLALTLTQDLRVHIRNKKDLARIDQLIAFIKKGRTFSAVRKKLKRLNIQKLLGNKTNTNHSLSLFNYEFRFDHQKKQHVWSDAVLYDRGE